MRLFVLFSPKIIKKNRRAKFLIKWFNTPSFFACARVTLNRKSIRHGLIFVRDLWTFFKNWSNISQFENWWKTSLNEALNERWRTSEKISALSLTIFLGISDSWHAFVWSRPLIFLRIICPQYQKKTDCLNYCPQYQKKKNCLNYCPQYQKKKSCLNYCPQCQKKTICLNYCPQYQKKTSCLDYCSQCQNKTSCLNWRLS